MKSQSSSLPINHISEGTARTYQYILDRKEGRITSLKTSKNKFNQALMNGLDWGRILTIAGLSSAGKSTILEEMKRDFIALNPTEKFDILSFEFEMLIEDQIARRLSAVTGKTVKELYSAFTPLKEIDKVKDILDEVAKDPIYYVDQVATVDEVESTVMNFAVNKSIPTDRGLVVTIDHVLLTKGAQGEKEKEIVDTLMHRLVAIKKKLSSMKVRVSFIVLSQLNREIEQPERVLKSILHFPTRNDIFGASSVYQCSDYLLISHRPANINGIRNYGPPMKSKGFPEGLPIRHEGRDVIYWHLIKERHGTPTLLVMLEDFANARVQEIAMEDLR